MKLYRLLPAFIMMFVACSSYSVKNEVNDMQILKGAKKMGIVVRSSLRSRISRDDMMTELSRTLNGYKHSIVLEFLPNVSTNMTDFATDDERFYQSAGDSDFLKYKSIGVVKSYMRSNNDEIRRIMDKDGFDGMIIYEEYAIISVEMQMMRMNTVLAITDKEGNIAYLDHQDNTYDSTETDILALKKEMTDRLSQRFINKIKDLDYIKNL
jgi:hypothetical protein